MVYAGESILYHPGQPVTAELVAAPDGTVAERNQMVELAGDAEQPQTPSVQTVQADGNGVGKLAEDAYDYDATATYAAGEVVGLVTLKLDGAVEWFNTADGYTPTVGDHVLSAAGGGVAAADFDGVDPDTPDRDVIGQVFSTAVGDFGPGTRVAVYRWR